LRYLVYVDVEPTKTPKNGRRTPEKQQKQQRRVLKLIDFGAL